MSNTCGRVGQEATGIEGRTRIILVDIVTGRLVTRVIEGGGLRVKLEAMGSARDQVCEERPRGPDSLIDIGCGQTYGRTDEEGTDGYGVEKSQREGVNGEASKGMGRGRAGSTWKETPVK